MCMGYVKYCTISYKGHKHPKSLLSEVAPRIDTEGLFTISSYAQMKKLKLKEVKWLAQDHTACE
jgi:hypothetical protein